LSWTDDDPELDTILESVTLYWLTETYARCIYPYREVSEDVTIDLRTQADAPQHHGTSTDVEKMKPESKKFHCDKPMGFSWFPKELIPLPKSWIATSGNLVFFRQHTSGGHFAALEKPQELWTDVREFVEKVWARK
jgi:microsomal epoxide hydrolase